MTPVSTPSSSTTGKVSRLYLSNISATSRSSASGWHEIWPPSLELRQRCRRVGEHHLGQRHRAHQFLVFVDQVNGAHALQRSIEVPQASRWRRPPAPWAAAPCSPWSYGPLPYPPRTPSTPRPLAAPPAAFRSGSLPSALPAARRAGRRPHRDSSPPRCPRRARYRANCRMETCNFGSISSSACAATSSSRVWKSASRSAGASSSMMSARSAGCSVASLSPEIFSFTRRAGSVSIRST